MNTVEVASASRQITSRGFCDGKIAGLYDLEETLGSGHFAVVKLARHVFTGAKVAVKVVDKTKLDDVSKAHLFQEVRCMKLVQHPNVVRLYEVIDTQTKLYLVLELGDGGDLYDYIMKHEGGLSEKLACKYFRQILRAITYCHQLHVVHRDLKPENVVFFEKLGIVKLTDFGFSNKFSPGQKLETFCGSLAYSAPEILLGDSYDAPAVDIWSLGVILYMLVCGQPPFEKANDSETLTMIMDCKYTVPSQITMKCKHLIGSMLVRDPQKRATLEEIASDPWLEEHSDPDAIDDTPLVSRKELSEADHSFIIQKMINGKISSKEEILQSLDKNKYNHITATYFLLAELRLRKYHEEQNQSTNNSSKRYNTDNANNTKIIPTTNKVLVPVSICPPTIYLTDTKPDKRNRKCSIVREEDEEESFCENACEMNKLKISVPRRESISDGKINRSVQDCSNTNIVVPIDLTFAQKMHPVDPYPNTMLSNTKAIIKNLDCMKKEESLRQLEIGKFQSHSNSGKNAVLTHRKTKINKIRTPSCSSSEASDDDTKTRSKKKMNKYVGDTPVRFRMHRRDSHDDSSDSQEQTFSSTGPHAQIGSVIPSETNVDGKKDTQSQNRETNKSEENRKSSHSHNQKIKKQSREYTDKHVSFEKINKTNHSNGRRRRVRESQSLDRITESQEYELRYKNAGIVEAYASFNEVPNSVLKTNDEYDENFIGKRKDSIQAKNLILNIMKETLHCRRSKSNFTHLGSMEEIDFILEEKSLMKTIQVTGTKCVVTLKKISRLGKYFPVVNFS